MYRVEDKYILPEKDFYMLEHRMSSVLKPDANSASGQGYKISSIYFDDVYDTHYRDTVDGVPYRNKYRIRIYDDCMKAIKLEVKTKQYSRISKRSATITEDELWALVRGECIECSDDLDDPRTAFDIAIKTRMLKPKVIVTYERKAFVYESGNVRITFDYNIRGSKRIDLFGDENLVYDYPRDTGLVLEVKYDGFLPDFIAQSLEIDTMLQTSNSKYRICRELYA
jgi:hypothetical protein